MDRESFLFCREDNADTSAQFLLSMKKEVPFAKARSIFNESSVDSCMKEEFTGLVKKWHLVTLQNIPINDRKSILPGQGLVKEKPNGMKGRFVGGGHRQDISQYDIYREVFTPTAGLSSFLQWRYTLPQKVSLLVRLMSNRLILKLLCQRKGK